MTIKIFPPNDLRTILCSAFVRKSMTSNFEKNFTATFNKHAPTKIKTVRGNQKPHINKTFRKAIMKRPQLKNKANKTRKATDVSNYKKQRNYKL